MNRALVHFAPVRRAFTLAELIVATIILTVVVGATTIAVSQSLRSRDGATAAGDAFSRAQLGAARIAADIQQALRDPDLTYAKVAIVRGGPAGKSSQGLLLFAHQVRAVRSGADAIEGEEYEVHYRLEPAAIVSRTASVPMFALWRRSDPVPDDVVDGGGVATPVVDGVVSLAIDAYDGSGWRSDWDSDADGYPQAIRVVIAATDDGGRYTKSARRIVALDRTPPPLNDEEGEADPAATPATGTGGTTTGGGTP